MAYIGYSGGSASSGSAPSMTAEQAALAGQFSQGGFGVGSTGGALSQPTQQITPYGTQVQDLQGLFNLYQPQFALAGALGNQQMNQLTAGNYFNNESLQAQMNQANQSAAFQQAGYGLDAQSLAIQQGALARQMNLLPQQYGIQQQQFGLQGQQLDLSQQEAWQNAQQQQQGLASQLTASGNPYSVGGATQRQQIQTGLQNQLTGLGINRQQLGLQQQSAGLNYQEQLASTQDAQKQLGIQSQRLGLSENEVTSRLDNALAQLGLQGQVNSYDLMNGISQIQQGEMSPLSGLISLIMQQTNLPLLAGQGQ